MKIDAWDAPSKKKTTLFVVTGELGEHFPL